jgi:hypothetical protein
MAAIYCGRAIRPDGLSATKASIWGRMEFRTLGVSTGPGQTAFTRTPLANVFQRRRSRQTYDAALGR